MINDRLQSHRIGLRRVSRAKLTKGVDDTRNVTKDGQEDVDLRCELVTVKSDHRQQPL